jgi:hypothetical protein
MKASRFLELSLAGFMVSGVLNLDLARHRQIINLRATRSANHIRIL